MEDGCRHGFRDYCPMCGTIKRQKGKRIYDDPPEQENYFWDAPMVSFPEDDDEDFDVYGEDGE